MVKEYLHFDGSLNLTLKGLEDFAMTGKRLVCNELGTTYESDTSLPLSSKEWEGSYSARPVGDWLSVILGERRRPVGDSLPASLRFSRLVVDQLLTSH